MQTNQLNNVQQLLTQHLGIWTSAETEKKSGRGRASGNSGSVYGIKKLRELILELAVRGKLVPQDAEDEPASELLRRIQAEKAKLIADGKLKKEKLLAPISEEEKPFELPKGWEIVRLREIATHLGDGLHGTPVYDTTGKYYFVNGNNLKDGKIVIKNETKTVDVAEYEKYKKPLNSTSILVSINGTLGTVGFYDGEPIVLGKSACYINLVQEKISKYFVKLLIDAPSFMKYAIKNAAGTTIKNLGLKAINEMPIALPPIAEQHRIVAKVDALMTLCDQLENQHLNAAEAHETLVSELLATLTQSQDAADFNGNGQRIYAHFDVLFTTQASIAALKQTLLQLAVMGKLVPQDPNDEPASELLKRIQAEKAKLIAERKLKKEKPLASISEDEKPFKLPNRWEWVRLSEVSTYIQYGYTDSANKMNKEILLLRITDIQDDFVDWATVPGCNSNSKQVQDYLLSENDIVIARTGGTIGKSYLVKNLTVNSIFASYLIRIGKIESIHHKFKKLYFGSLLYWNQLYANSMGTGQPNVNGTALKGLVFTLPPLAEQHRIVAKVDALMAICDQLSIRIQIASQQKQLIADALGAQAAV